MCKFTVSDVLYHVKLAQRTAVIVTHSSDGWIAHILTSNPRRAYNHHSCMLRICTRVAV